MRSDKVILLEEAGEDLEIGRAFYGDQEEDIGAYFVTSLLSDITSLHLYSGIHPVHFEFFRMLSKRFPFAIYDGVASGVTRVVATLDMRQDPKSIRKAPENRKIQEDLAPIA